MPILWIFSDLGKPIAAVALHGGLRSGFRACGLRFCMMVGGSNQASKGLNALEGRKILQVQENLSSGELLSGG